MQARGFPRWTVTSVPLTRDAGEASAFRWSSLWRGELGAQDSGVWCGSGRCFGSCARTPASLSGGRGGCGAGGRGAQSITGRSIALFSVNRCSPRLFLNLPSGKTSLTRWEERPRDHFYSTTWDSFLAYNFILLDMIFGKWPETREHMHSIETRQLWGYPFSLSLQNGREIISHPLVCKGQKHMDTSRKKSTGSKAMLSLLLFLLHLPWTVALNAPQAFANSLPSLPQSTLQGVPGALSQSPASSNTRSSSHFIHFFH